MKLFTLVHIATSLAGILSGLVVLLGLLAAKQFEGWNRAFLATTLTHTLSALFFLFHGPTPATVVGHCLGRAVPNNDLNPTHNRIQSNNNSKQTYEPVP